jgi:hypothetical protein
MPDWDLEHWNTAAGPPGCRGSAPATTEEVEDMADALPGPDEPVSFEAHIKPLFREKDRSSMQFAFDLWDYDDVREHADDIVERIEDGSMPCDGAWSEDQSALIARWVSSGMPE